MSGKLIVIMMSFVVVFTTCDAKRDQEAGTTQVKDSSVVEVAENKNAPLVTFVELGSVNCIPCVKMQPVMKNIEEKYGHQIEIIFYDVWQADQKEKAGEYGIRLIPTQVFLDASGLEIFRHEGFFPEVEIDQFLIKQGLVPTSEG